MLSEDAAMGSARIECGPDTARDWSPEMTNQTTQDRPNAESRMRRTPLQIIGLAALILTSCSSSDSDNADATFAGDGGVCGVTSQRLWVDNGMRDFYLFRDQVPNLRLEDYDSAEALIQDLRVPPDRFSYVGDAALNDAFFEEGQDYGYGWRLRRQDDNSLVVALVEPLSPLADAGVKRGELLRTVNGTDVNSIGTTEQVNAIFGTGTESRTLTLGMESQDGTIRSVDVTRGQYAVQAVLDTKVIETDTARVGYLSFLTFIETANDELQTAFEQLANENVDELVIDLRYNGGGRISVANVLASRVVGTGGAGHDFLRLQYNDFYQNQFDPDSLRRPFLALDNALDLSRVYVLTQPGTCSSSELVINGLSPLVDVITVGDTTCGKPFGTRGRDLDASCNKVMHAVEVEFVNDAGVGGYADGIAATCAATDSYASALGDPQESMLATALQHVATGACETSIAASLRSPATKRSNSSINPVNPHSNGFPLP